ncbi:CHAT domain-containing protein [Sulfidibacter corallicola]|uniref:CHAT domain-containing protein n=1 Tax=Sulfidibacter corallicola TaxID=2818388 RepID=A0A8A4TJH8_SULCO|nr:CHAT domain-containing protein [Sulfidibacter corallicola]QTD50076.1 CHAT domain-containing protein [Sulfidibacter corallicola]
MIEWSLSAVSDGRNLTLTLADADGQVRGSRHLTWVRAGRLAYPCPPSEEIAGLAQDHPAAELTATQAATKLLQAFRDLSDGTNEPDLVARIGAWLFAMLLGADQWEAIRTEAAGQPIHLRLVTEDARIAALPWELMRHENRFLLEAGLQISRTLPHDPNSEIATRLIFPVKVLFVIGSDLKDKRVQAGAEFLGLIQRVAASQFALQHRLLLNPNQDRLRDEVAAFQPHLVHFICHGDFSPDGCILELRSEEGTERLSAEALAQILTRPQGTAIEAPMVVLNACHSGGYLGGLHVSTPMAWTLVAEGLPLAVGMSGRVADDACRRFTSNFYKAILLGEAPEHAVWLGRSATFGAGHDPLGSLDWAKPVLVCRQGFRIGICPDAKADAEKLLGQARRLTARREDRLGFYGRDRVCRAARQLMTAQQGVTRTLLVVQPASPLRTDDKFGLSRTLRELAHRFMFEGLAPCLLDDRLIAKASRQQPPDVGDALTLAYYLVQSIRETGKVIGLPLAKSRYVNYLIKWARAGAQPEQLPDDLAPFIEDWADEVTETMVAAAVRLEFKAFMAACDRLPIALIDYTHLKCDNGLTLLIEFLDDFGLGDHDQPIPVVVTVDRTSGNADQGPRLDRLKTWKAGLGEHALTVDLTPFADAEEALAYKRYLLDQSPPLVPDMARLADWEQGYLLTMQQLVEGVPSRLAMDTPMPAVTLAKNLNILREADPADLLPSFETVEADG